MLDRDNVNRSRLKPSDLMRNDGRKVPLRLADCGARNAEEMLAARGLAGSQSMSDQERQTMAPFIPAG
jgi:hypothetical protein